MPGGFFSRYRLRFPEKKKYLGLRENWYNGIIDTWETREPGGLPSFIGGANPPDERKEGVANGYIF